MENIYLLGLIAGVCTALGAVFLFIKKQWTDRSLAIFLGLAAGVMVAVVVFDMLPSALLCDYRGAIAGVFGGILLLLFLDRCILQRFSAADSLIGLGYLIMLGIALHDLPEGMAIALGNEMKARTGMVIALGIGVHNIPEGMAIAAPLIMGGMKKTRIFIQILLLGLITPLGTIIGRAAVVSMPQFLPFLLGFASGIMIYLVLFQLWPQARFKNRKSRWWGFLAGILIIFTATFI
jgi:ZIP family zinc transporter